MSSPEYNWILVHWQGRFIQSHSVPDVIGPFARYQDALDHKTQLVREDKAQGRESTFLVTLMRPPARIAAKKAS